MDQNDLSERVAKLSPVKRALLEEQLKKTRGAYVLGGKTIPRRLSRESASLSFAQERLWFINQLEPESPAYNEPRVIRLSGSLNVKAIEEALNHIVARHEVLRTTIVVADGRPAQRIAERRTIDLPVIDLRTHSVRERDVEARRLIDETIRHPFNLSTDLMLRPLLLQLGDQEHVLVLVKHHVATDGWSSGIFWRELGILYRAFSTGQAANLRELPIQYADYAEWQRELLQGEMLETQISYWKQQLAGVADLQLPTDRPRPAVQSYRGARQSVSLSRELTDRLISLSRKENATLYMVLLAAFQTLLSRYSGQMTIAVGSPIANRTRPEIETLIGFFANTLVLRGDLSDNPTFKELLVRMKNVALDAYAHQDLPFEKLVAELRPERNLSNSPLFQAMFVFQNAPREALTLPGLTTSNIEPGKTTAKFDLLLSLRDDKLGLRGALEYSTDLFDESTITRMLRHFRILLESIVADPNQRTGELPLLAEADRHRLLLEWNDTRQNFLKDKSVVEMFENQVERAPDSLAVIFENRTLTYRELNQRANQLAHYLIRQGVHEGTHVAVCLKHSINLAIGLLAILKAGGVYLPLEPSYPQERLAFMLHDAQAPLVITTQSIARISCDGVESIFLDLAQEDIAREGQSNLGLPIAPDSSAYMLYTSGSTGRPKGVGMGHGALRNLISWQLENFSALTAARTLQFASPGFDVSIQEIFSTWCGGGSLVLIDDELKKDAPRLLQYLDEQAIERLYLPFVALQQLADAGAEPLRTLKNLREIITAGEQLRLSESLRVFLGRLGDCCLRNQYGPTESHVATQFTLKPPFDDLPDLPPIGRPIANTQIYNLDSYLNPVPVGVPGELHIGGVGLARGYLNRPELTAEKFIPNPFSTEPGARLYKTGDLSRYLPDGNIEFLGRIDNQVKIRGYRIEPGEIEVVLGEHPSVQAVIVLAREDSPGNKRLVAYVVAAPGSTPPTNELRSFLQQKLPDYMVPSVFLFLESLPLTLNGKVDRKSLPAPDQSRPELEHAYTAPRTPVEELLAQICAKILKLDKVGIHDNFFHLGGHSLLATQVVSRVRQALQMELPLRTLFEAPTVAELALKIEPSLPELSELDRSLAEVELLSEEAIKSQLTKTR
jgi:amino acid adenylation domain-containing protein